MSPAPAARMHRDGAGDPAPGPAPPALRGAELGARAAVAAGAVAFAALFLAVACLRIPYPFELEWVEGSMLLQARRLLAGGALYVAPTLEYAPVTYPPVYSLLAAGLCALAGLSYAPLRLISAAATLASFAVIYRYVVRSSGNRAAGLAAAGLYAASFRIAGAWFDTARVDSLHLLFQLAAIYAARFGSTRRGQLGCGALVSLAFLTKQSGLAAALPLLLACFVLHGRVALWAAGSALALMGGCTLALQLASDGWYGYFLFGQYASHGFVDRWWLAFWTEDLALHFGPATALALVATAADLRDRRRFAFHALVGAGMIGMAYASRVHLGGYANVLMPAYAWIAVLAGLALAWADAEGRRRWRAAPLLFQAACALQLALLVYDPRAQVPDARDVAAGRRLVAELAAAEGEVLVPSRNYLPVFAGKRPSLHNTAMFGIFGDARLAEGRALEEEFLRSLRERRYALIVSSGPEPYQKLLDRHYRLRAGVFGPGDRDAFWTLTGLRTRPHLFYVPREESR